MKKGWETKRIGEIATIKPPKSEARERVSADALVSFLPMEDLGVAVKYPQPKHTKRLSDVVGSYTYFAEGDVLLAKITPCFENGKLGIAKELMNGIGFGSSEFIVIRPDSTVSNEWLFHFLSRDVFRNEGAQRMGGAVGQQRVPKEFVESYALPVPPLPEQKRIVGMLDNAFADLATAQANAEKNLQNARALFESHLQSVFTHRGKGWMEKRLDEVGTTQTGSTPKTSDHSNYGNFIPFIKPGDFKPDGALDYENEGLSKKGLDASRKVAASSVLMVCIGATIGKCGYCDRDVTTNQQINALTPYPETNCLFMYFQMLTENFQHRVRLNAGQATLPIISKGKWSALTVVIPPSLEEQKWISDELNALSTETQRLACIYEQKQAALAELKKSLLHQAFSGNL